MARKQKPKAPAKTYDWRLTAGGVSCFESSKSKQVVSSFWEVYSATLFHDDALSRATRKVQSILEAIPRPNGKGDGKRQLSIIDVAGRPFLVWARSVRRMPTGGTKSDADIARLVRSLKLQNPASLEKGPSEPARQWYLDSDGIMHCFVKDFAGCTIIHLWEAAALTAWHTEALASATKEIQAA